MERRSNRILTNLQAVTVTASGSRRKNLVQLPTWTFNRLQSILSFTSAPTNMNNGFCLNQIQSLLCLVSGSVSPCWCQNQFEVCIRIFKVSTWICQNCTWICQHYQMDLSSYYRFFSAYDKPNWSLSKRLADACASAVELNPLWLGGLNDPKLPKTKKS